MTSANAYDSARNPFGLDVLLHHLQKDQLLLDAGCGTGQHALRLRNAVRAVHGIDIDESRIHVARSAASDLQNIQFDVASITKLPFAEESFDVALACQVLHHLVGHSPSDIDSIRKEVLKALAELARVVKKGGRLFLINTSCKQRREAYWHFDLFPKSAWERLEGLWTLGDGEWFADAMKTNGFQLEDSITPPDSHWVGACDVSMVKLGLDEKWRSTDVAFDLLINDELDQFISKVKNLSEREMQNIVDRTEIGKRTLGEATVHIYIRT